MTSDRAREIAQNLVARADELLQEPVDPDERTLSERRRLDWVGLRGWLAHPMAAVLLTAIVVATVSGAVLLVVDHRSGGPGFGPVLLRILAAWMFASAPAWIYVGFLRQRIPTIWSRYVVDLYRLGIDRTESLPRPPLTSPYYRRWKAAGDKVGSRHDRLYREKFDAVYGSSTSDTGLDRLHRVRVETLLPVLLLTSLLGVCWTVLLWNLDPNIHPGATQLWRILTLGFLGAYVSGSQLIVRRYLQNDLRPHAYFEFLLRIGVGLLLAGGAHALLDYVGVDTMTQSVVAFVVGLSWIAIVGAIRIVATSVRRAAVPSLRPTYPLSDLDGMTVLNEARLLEEGIEDMTALVNANLVDLMLRTGVPTSRLIDWVDQALLLVHAEASGHGLASALRRLGIRTATDFLALFPAEGTDRSRSEGIRTEMLDHLARAGMDTTTVRRLSRTLAREPSLGPVRNWKAGSADLDDHEATRADHT